MKYVEITTPQNVTIRYTLATFWERAIATVLDAAIITVSSLILYWLFDAMGTMVATIMYSLVLVPFIVFYSLAFEMLNNGQSIGKMALRLRVVRIDGEQVTPSDYLMRWIFRGVDIYFSFGTIGMLSVIAGTRNQRVGDLLGNTIVVNVSKRERLSIENLLSLNKIKDKKISFPQVTKLPEETFLLVRETLNKQKRFRNEAHDEAMKLLVDRICELLELDKPKNNERFLQTLLNDYIVLTR